MYRTIRFRTAVLRSLLATSLLFISFFAEADKLDTQRLLYDQAMDAIEKGDTSRYRQLESGLRDYPLYGYLVLAKLNQDFSSASDEQITVFLRTYGDLPFANRLKARWLYRLADQGKWSTFEQNYTTADQSAGLECKATMRRWDQGQSAAAMQEAQALWTVGRSQPNACDPLFARWQQAGGRTDDVVWQRIRLALLYRQDGLARYLTKLMSSNKQLAERFVETAAKPTALRDSSNYRISASQPADKLADIATVALRRLGQRVLHQQPTVQRDFYGFLAAERSNQPYALNHVSAPVSDQLLERVKALPATQRAYEFLARDELTEARREWYHAGDNFSREELMAQAKLAREMGWYFPAIRGISIAEYWDALDIRFPMAYREPIVQQAQARQINSSWVYAITRQESAFMADARSHAGAMGLMQLMPATARETARQYDIPYGRSTDALIPERNIAIGAAYLSRLSGQFNGNRVLASAAYNAGPGRVRQWTRGMGNLPADVWVEAIPFDETRKYVQSVLSYAVIYGEKLGIKQSVMDQHERYLEF